MADSGYTYPEGSSGASSGNPGDYAYPDDWGGIGCPATPPALPIECGASSTLKALKVLEAIRWRLDDLGGDTGAVPSGHFAYWQADDAACLWKNRELMLYMTQTVREIGLRSPCRDGLHCTIMGMRDVRVYQLPPGIIQVESVTRADGEPLVKTTIGELEAVTTRHRHRRSRLHEDWRSREGLPTHYLTDEQKQTITIYPTPPSDDYPIYLVALVHYQSPPSWDVLRLESVPTAPLLLPDSFEEAVIVGVCARAYRKRDSDTFNAELVQQYEAEFTAIVGSALSSTQRDSLRAWANASVPVEPNTYFAL